jgi:hypothetical protein
MNTLYIFYGEDITRDGPEGLDLSRCETKNVIVEGLVSTSFTDVRRRIRAEFGPEIGRKKMVVEAVVCKRVGEGYQWALRQVKGENSWGSYMRFASTPGAAMYEQPMVYVHFIDGTDEPGSSSAAGEVHLSIAALAIDTEALEHEPLENNGPYSMAIVDLNERLENQPDELDSGDDDRSSSSEDEDEDEGGGPSQRMRAVAQPMAPEDINALVIGHDDSSVRGVGATILQEKQHFPSKDAADMAIKRYAISISRQHKVKKSNPQLLKVICINKEESGCEGTIVARQLAGICQPWTITRMVPHSCEQPGTLPEHCNVSASYVAQIIASMVKDKISVSVKALQEGAADVIGFPVSYSKARRAKESVLEGMYGTYVQAYNNVPRMLHQISESNPGTVTFRMEREHPSGTPNHFILDRIFWAFSQTIQAFHHCRPVISIDGTFLTGQYRGTLLVAVASDANNQLLPIAYALVESETTEAWLWFLMCLKNGVVKARPGVCIISDRNQGLLNALNQMKNTVAMEYRWPDLETRWCMRHLAANFYSRFRNKECFKAFKLMCCQNQPRKFDALWIALNDATTTSSGDAPREPAGSGRRARNMSEWVSVNCPEIQKWVLAHDNGARYGIMTTNMSEVYNAVLKGVRSLPITALVAETWSRTVSYFADRVQVAHARVQLNKPWSGAMQKHLDMKTEKSKTHGSTVVDALRKRWEIRTRQRYVQGYLRGDRKQQVTLNPSTCECTCKKPMLYHYPCSHVHRAVAAQKISVEPYISPYYSTYNLMKTWDAEFWAWGVNEHHSNVWYGGPTWWPNPLMKRNKRGRPPTRRFRNDMDISQQGEGRRCRTCRMPGHTKKNCPERL